MGNTRGISEYIQEISNIIERRNKDGKKIVVYRGEPQDYTIPGKPGIFRENYLEREPFYEKNILNEMKVNRITSGNTYLECAVDAQHDEFPSRLLDVTYNLMVAMYFAVTPYYKKFSEDAYDEEHDGQVIIYFLPHMYCAGSKNIEDIFNKTIERDGDYLCDALIQENHKLVDHIKMNTRICVQQGAFILFQGFEYTPISKKDYEVVKIRREDRKRVRDELDLFFGINTGFIYPEPYNLSSTMGNKAYQIVNTSISEENELNCFMEKIEEELDYYFDCAISIYGDRTKNNKEKKSLILSIVMELEELLFKYREEMSRYLDKYELQNTELYKKRFEKIIDLYDSSFKTFESSIGITRSTEELRLE